MAVPVISQLLISHGSECLSVGADEHSVPVIRLMEADLQV